MNRRLARDIAALGAALVGGIALVVLAVQLGADGQWLRLTLLVVGVLLAGGGVWAGTYDAEVVEAQEQARDARREAEEATAADRARTGRMTMPRLPRSS